MRERPRAPASAPLLERARERLGVELDAIGADRRRPADRLRLGIDEQADADAARRADRATIAGSALGLGARPPAGLARDLARHHRHERALIGPHLLDEIEQLRPRIAFDVELDRRRAACAARARSSRTSSGVMWRRSARGCTVMPGAPAATQTSTASSTLGSRPPRELRSVATLLTLTDSRIMTFKARSAIGSSTSALSGAAMPLSKVLLDDVDDFLRPARGSRLLVSPSSMTRSSGSVPE